MMVQAPKEVGEIPIDTQDTPILTQPSSSQPHRKHKSRRKQRKETEVSQDETPTKEHIPTPSYDPLLSGEDRLQQNKLMEICTKLPDRVLSLEQIKTNQAAKIKKLKKRVKKLEGMKKKITHEQKRLYKVGLSARVESSVEEKDLAPHQDQPSFNQNYMQQTMPNPEDITDPTTAMNMALALMAKAFMMNYSTPTNNNQRISSNPRNRQIAQPGMNMGQDRQMQMVGGDGGNQFRQYVRQNARNLTSVQGNGNQNQIGNGKLVAGRAKGNAAGQNGNQIRCYNC
nr:hypothetical protein [Tanacetum cinerariifolium]